jgi:hypothetical protein
MHMTSFAPRSVLRPLMALCLLVAPPAMAGVNKCTGADGKVVYTEGPCEQNQTVTTIRTPPPAPAAVPAPRTSGGAGRLPPKNAHCKMLGDELEALNQKIRSKPNGDMAAAQKSQEIRERYDRYCIDRAAIKAQQAQQKADNLQRECEGTRNETIPQLERGIAELTAPGVATPRYEMIGRMRKLLDERKRFLAEKCR